ncbi:sensor histidine kinase [Butyrivibrio sp. JL13D10]|uniref:sensor histidine kinase n=1 Tax=Butyrivibrio sp. JL13D10 TaxID=3236815 RepID=UPI0038B43380
MKNIESKKGSFIRSIAIASIGYLALMIIILSAVWWNTSKTLEDSAAAALSQAREIASFEIDEVLKSNEQALAVLLQNNENIRIFEQGNENQRAIAAQNMVQMLQKAAMTSSDVQTLVFYDLVGDTYIARTEQGVPYSETENIEKTIRQLVQDNPGNMPSSWFYWKIGEDSYLLRMYKNKKRMLGALIKVEYISGIYTPESKIEYTLVADDGRIIAEYGDEESLPRAYASEQFIQKTGWSDNGKFFITGADFSRGDFNLFLSMTRNKVYGGFQLLQITIIFLVIAAIFMLVMVSVYARKMVYTPLLDLLSAMKKIENGDQTVRLSGEAATVEFQQINTNFNQMMDTIVNLRMKSYEERIAFDEATLKYVQLQIKPHFFLNALTTIHSMSYKDKNEEIREYIERLSRNVRYLFKSGLHTVPLSEETEHARDYMAMQEILYPGCVFDFIDIEEGLEDYPVPQLLVHTILENIYKHAVSVDRLISILISAKTEIHDGEDMCHIVVEDDGDGFPEEFLTEVKNGHVKVKENGHGVGLWNLKKTLSLMYRRDDLIEFSNKDPHGSCVDMWIPRRVKRQSSLWK